MINCKKKKKICLSKDYLLETLPQLYNEKLVLTQRLGNKEKKMSVLLYHKIFIIKCFQRSSQVRYSGCPGSNNILVNYPVKMAKSVNFQDILKWALFMKCHVLHYLTSGLCEHVMTMAKVKGNRNVSKSIMGHEARQTVWQRQFFSAPLGHNWLMTIVCPHWHISTGNVWEYVTTSGCEACRGPEAQRSTNSEGPAAVLNEHRGSSTEWWKD